MSRESAEWTVNELGQHTAVINGREYRVCRADYRWALEGHLEDPLEREAVPSVEAGKELAELIAADPDYIPT